MDHSLLLYAVAAVGVLFAGISKGGFGSGAAFVGGVLIALVADPATALAIMLPLLMLMDVTALPAFWRRWDGRAALVLILGAVPGVVIATLVFNSADPDTIRILIGLVALAFVAWQGLRASGVLRVEGMPTGPVSGAAWGAVAGFTSFVSHAGGPPAAVYLLSRNLTKEMYQATTVIVFWAVNLMKVGPYVAMGAIRSETLWLDLWLAPLAMIGVVVGVRLHRRIPEIWFFRLTYALLTVTGAKLIWDGLT